MICLDLMPKVADITVTICRWNYAGHVAQLTDDRCWNSIIGWRRWLERETQVSQNWNHERELSGTNGNPPRISKVNKHVWKI